MDKYIIALRVRSHDTVNVISTAHIAERSWYTLSQCHGTEQQISAPTEAPGAVPPVARPHVLAAPGTVCSAPPGGRVITDPGPVGLAGGGAGVGDGRPGAPPSIHRPLWSGYNVVVTDNILKTKHLQASSVHRLRLGASTVLLTAIRRTGGIALSLRHLPAWSGRTVAVGALWGKT